MGEPLYAGAGKAEIVFPDGYFPTVEYTRMYSPSYVRVLKLKSGASSVALAVFELPSIRPWEYTQQLRMELSGMLQVPQSAAWVCMTHSLSAPHVPQDGEKRKMHLCAVRRALQNAAAAASSTMERVKIGFGVTTSDVNANRDVRSVDGWWVGIAKKGISNKDVTYLRLDTENGRCKAVLFSYALKSSCLEGLVLPDGSRMCSPDVCGVACEAIEKETGAIAVFVMGAAGDQVPKKKAAYLELDTSGRFYPVMAGREAFHTCDTLGAELANDIISALKETIPMNDEAELFADQLTITVEGKQPYPKTLPAPPVLHYEYQPAEPQQVDIYLMRIGMAWIMGLKAEVTTPVFEKLKEQAKVPLLVAATLVNGGQGYFATDIDYERYSYPGLHTMFAKGADGVLIEAVADYLNKAQGK